MRISPLLLNHNTRTNKAQNTQTRFERNDISLNTLRHHQYSGVASADLAYASLKDNAIARDLKLMGLI